MDNGRGKKWLVALLAVITVAAVGACLYLVMNRDKTPPVISIADDGFIYNQSMMIIILLANVLLSVGTPGIPGGAIASFAALATMAGLPAGVMGVYISINTLCDMGATCVNVIGDLAACVVLKEKIKLDE